MTIPLTGAGGLFVRVGHIGGIVNVINTHRGDTTGAAIPAKVAILEADYPSTNHQDLIDGIYRQLTAWQQASGGFLGQLSQLATRTIITMADDDVLLTRLDITTALKELIRQMLAAAQTVDRPIVSVTVTPAGTNSGDAVVLATITGRDGKQLDYVFAENIDVLCTADSQGSATLSQEPLSVRGDVAQNSRLSFDWPDGSGASTSLRAITATQDAGSNLLANSDYEDFTVANTPDRWPILVGSAGTTIFKSSTPNAYAGAAALQYTGDGAQLTSVAQTFNDSVLGTAAKLKPQMVYGFNCRVKVSSVPAAGVLELSLIDGSNVIINNDAGAANSATKSLPAATTTYVAFNGTFRTPSVLPAVQKFRVRLSTALTSTVSVFIDHLAFAEMTQAYPGGPFLKAFSGASKLILNDSFVVTAANDYQGLFQLLFERLFGMRALGLQLPSASGGGTISDALVT